MDIDTIAAELTQRFDALLPDYHRRRIIFWLDEEGAFADELDDFHLPNATLVRRTETNGFALKKLLCTYVEALPKLINTRTGHIHTSFNQAVTDTGRLS